MNKVIYLKAENKSVFLKYLEDGKICEYYKININSILFKILKKINAVYIILGDWKYKIKEYDCVILGENTYSPCISKYIKKKNPNCKTILYFWNIVSEYKIYQELFKDNNIDEFWTFDKNDAEKYNMKYNPQFYTNNVKLNKKNNKYDVLFLGRPKSRKEAILKLKNELIEKDLRVNFKIIEKEKDYIPYDNYLEILAKTKCILDYNQDGQIGLSLRPMEALFLEKKLITNNEDIKNYNFYNPNNIFILGEDNIEKIKDFIEKPYEKIEQKIIDYYDFKEWIKRFGVKENEF